MNGSVRILGIPGSLRKASFNRAALRAAQELVPPDATLDTFDLEGVPPFNEDHEQTPPARVIELKAKIREADAILIATPEKPSCSRRSPACLRAPSSCTAPSSRTGPADRTSLARRSR